MSNKEIEAWKVCVAKEKDVFVATGVKTIHPVVDKIVRHLLEIELIKYVRVTQTNLYASNEITLIGRTKTSVSKAGHPTAVGVQLILEIEFNTIQFYEITSALRGYGGKMVQAVMTAIPEDWQAVIVMDWSDGFWDRMAKKYDNIVIL